MNREEIKNIIPHREDMLLVDTAEIINETTARGTLKITGDEFFLRGHFPNNPVVPGVILCEAMAQASCVLIQNNMENCTPYFAKMDNVKFKNKVLPGDTLESVCTFVKNRGVFYYISAKGYVKGKLCVSAELTFALVKNEE